MTPTGFILITAPFMLTGLLLSERSGRTPFKIAFKFLLSSFFILVAILQTAALSPFAVAADGPVGGKRPLAIQPAQPRTRYNVFAPV